MARFLYLPEYKEDIGGGFQLWDAEIINVDCITNVEQDSPNECILRFDITGRSHMRPVPGTLKEWHKKLQEA